MINITKKAHEQNPSINHLKRSNFFKDMFISNKSGNLLNNSLIFVLEARRQELSLGSRLALNNSINEILQFITRFECSTKVFG